MATCTIDTLLSALETLAPPEGAAEWDNTGLLIQGEASPIGKVLITLDLTPDVAREACRISAQAVISYHPPIFGGLSELTEADPLQAGLLELIRNGIHVYSPHTALDAAAGGLTDWLTECFVVKQTEVHEGSARIVTLQKPLRLEALCDQWRAYLKAPYLRVSTPEGRSRSIRTLALCPGAGASALAGLKVDAVLTGEMKHHDILAWQRQGTTVILSEHGHTERPFLSVLRQRLSTLLPGVKIVVSKKDREPLTLVQGNA